MSGKPLQPGFVIHRRDYRNTSLLLELFTLKEGLLPAIARGAKSGRGQRAMLLQPFTPLQVGLSGKGEIKTLAQVEPEGRAFGLSGKTLYCGFYLNELLLRLLHRHDPHAELFVHYFNTLTALAQNRPIDAGLRAFEVRLLKEIGYELLLDREGQTGAPICPDARYEYVLEQGPKIVAGNSPTQGVSVHGRTLLCLHSGEAMERAGMQEAKRLMRFILAFYLGDKPLKSRELFRSFAKSGR